MKTPQEELVAICRLWYVTREATQGLPVHKEAADALTAFDSYVQGVVERQNIQWYNVVGACYRPVIKLQKSTEHPLQWGVFVIPNR